MNPANTIQIAVIGGRRSNKKALVSAEEVGELIASRGWQLICGGLGGVMEAACKGARNANGTAIGILPKNNRNKANPYVEIAIATNMGIARNSIIAHSADGAIAIDGKYGTLSEIAHFLQLGKPVVTLLCNWNIKGTIPVKSPRQAIEILEKKL